MEAETVEPLPGQLQLWETEAWRPVVSFEGIFADVYEVSTLGGLRNGQRKLKGSPAVRGGYPLVTLSRNGTQRAAYIHRLVLEAFAGPCPDGMEACHFNDDPTDNRLSNLRWDTRSANMLDKVRNGNHHNTQKTHCPRGHEYTDANTRLYRGLRHCRQCDRERQRRNRAKRKAG